MAKQQVSSKLLSRVARGLQIAHIGRRLPMQPEETVPHIYSGTEENHTSESGQESSLTAKSDVLPKNSGTHVESIGELKLQNHPAAVSRNLSKQISEPINSGLENSMEFNGTDSEAEGSANIGPSDNFDADVTLSHPKSSESNLSHSDEGIATQFGSERASQYVADPIKRNSVSHIESNMNYPAAGCEISDTKFPSFRLIRNLSEEGFPLRFDFGNDNKQQSRSKLRGIITKTTNYWESDTNHAADNTRDEVLPAVDHDRIKIQYENANFGTPLTQKKIESADQSIIGDERARSVNKIAEHLPANDEMRMRTAEQDTIAHIVKPGIFKARQKPKALSADAKADSDILKEPAQNKKSLHIGAININVRQKENSTEETWPEAPKYADHVITDDWDWSCRYGR